MPPTETTNPLLDLADPLPFDKIRGEHVEPAVAALLAEARGRLDAVIAGRGAVRTYDDTLGALEAVTEPLELAMGVVAHLESVATTPELREAHAAVQPEVSAFESSIVLSEGVWGAIKGFAATEEARGLQGPERRFCEKTVAHFRRNGADLDPAGKARLSDVDVELASLTLKYAQNVLDATNAFDLVVDDPARLAGLPEQAVEAARESAAQKGVAGHRFTLQAPSYLPAMTYLDDRAVRERLYRAYNTRAASGETDNSPLVARILELRREKAGLLGFASFADLVLEDRMAKTGAAARRFIDMLRQKTERFFARENADLAAFRRELEGASAPALMPWDVTYYAEKLRRARFDFDEEALRPYFPLDRVIDGLFEVARRLYGVTVEPWAGAPVWHETVRAFVLREADGTAGAVFYVDVTPRESKRDGAWMHGLHTALPGAPRLSRHIEVLAGNLTPPLGDRPALLSHREVETLFHEFGHLMHHASSRVPVRSLAGTAVAWDFVELPSQIMENWCWEREALDLFARHHETGRTLPEELLSRMRAARTFRAANAMMRQLGFAEVDLALHMDYRPQDHGPVVAYARAIMERFSAVPLPADHAMITSFSHLFSSPVGYAAGYYSYKWAEVLEADAFSRFLREGLFNPEVGLAFRAGVLARGDSEDPAELFRGFMGRDPDLDALLARDGLVGGGGVSDSVVRAITEDGSFRVIVALTTATVRGATRAQGAEGAVAQVLGELVTGAVLVREAMAPKLRVQVILRSAGGEGTLVADAHPDGTSRGLVSFGAGHAPRELRLGKGALLQVMRTLPSGALHQGVVAVPEGSGVSGALMAYMQESEQVVSTIGVAAVLEGEGVAVAGGYLVQLLPEVERGPLAVMTERLADFTRLDEVLPAPSITPDALLAEILYGMPYARLEASPLDFGCQCSQLRVVSTLATLPRSDIEDMVKDGEVLEIHCDYCRKEYRIPPAQLTALLVPS